MDGPRERSQILNNTAGNNATVFQFNFIVNNLRFDLISILSSLWLQMETGSAFAEREGGGAGLMEGCRNGEWHH